MRTVRCFAHSAMVSSKIGAGDVVSERDTDASREVRDAGSSIGVIDDVDGEASPRGDSDVSSAMTAPHRVGRAVVRCCSSG